ncbi:MAG: phage minor head protein, partial [Pseudonocardiaceae bacterium]
YSPYGFSAVEQALQDVDLYLRRFEWDKAQYTDGVQPAGWIKNTGLESWTPQQLLDYNRAFNDMYSGQTLARMRYHLLPPGMEPMESADIPEKFKPDYHLHLVKLVAMHFDVTLAELGFTEAKGLGSAGYHEGQENVQQRKATNPTLKWLQSVLTQISRTHLGMPGELEFRFLGLDAEEEAAADSVIDEQLKSGRITFNEAREEMGRAPYAFDEADMPIVETARGIIFLENSSKLVAAGELVTPAQAPPITGPPEGSDADPSDPHEDDAPTTPPAARPAPAVPADAKKTELATYYKWVSNGRPKRRPFQFEHLNRSEALLHEIDPATVLFKAAGSEAAPKDRDGRNWPAWNTDLAIAHHWAGQLRTALTGAPARAIASQWLQARKAAQTDPGTEQRRRDALMWLAGVGFTLTPRIRGVLAGLYTDAYMVGDQSAQVLLGQIEHTGWGDWKPGDTTTAQQLITNAGTGAGLATLLRQADQVAAGINHTRMQSIATALADTIGTDTTEDDLDTELRDLLDDAASAEMVGITETVRAISAAAIDRYTIAPGITNYQWATAADTRVCPACAENEAAGPIPIGASFPNGPCPQHPGCRCAIVGVPGASNGLFGL